MKHCGTEVFVKYKIKFVNKERHYIVNIYFVAAIIFIHSPKVQMLLWMIKKGRPNVSWKKNPIFPKGPTGF